LEIFQVDKENWNDVNTSFLYSFEPKYSAKRVCANLQDLTQRPGEGVYIYFAKNIETFKRFMASKPNTMPRAMCANEVSKKKWTDS